MYKKISKRFEKILESIRTEGLCGYLKRLYDLGEYRHQFKKILLKNKIKTRKISLWGYPLSLPTRGAGIKEELVLFGTHEPFATQLYQKYLHPNDIIFDIGTNIGYYFIAADKALDGKCIIHGFEPDPELFSLGVENSTHCKGHVIMNQMAVSEKEGYVAFFRSEVSNWGTLLPREDMHLTEQIDVPATTVDSYCTEHRIKPNVMRMDVEGSEILVLRGATETLKSVRLLYIELHCVILGEESLNEIFGILHEAGFNHAVWLNRYYDWPWSKRAAQEKSLRKGNLTDLKDFSLSRKYGVVNAFIFSEK